MGHAIEQVVIDERHQREVRAPLGLGRFASEIARLGAQREEERRRERRVDRDGALAQVLEHDRRGRAEVGADVAPRGARAARPQRVVIDDDVDAVAVGQRVVAGLGLAVDQRDGVELSEVDALDGRERHLEVLDHRAVLRAADDAAVRERRA